MFMISVFSMAFVLESNFNLHVEKKSILIIVVMLHLDLFSHEDTVPACSITTAFCIKFEQLLYMSRLPQRITGTRECDL